MQQNFRRLFESSGTNSDLKSLNDASGVFSYPFSPGKSLIHGKVDFKVSDKSFDLNRITLNEEVDSNIHASDFYQELRKFYLNAQPYGVLMDVFSFGSVFMAGLQEPFRFCSVDSVDGRIHVQTLSEGKQFIKVRSWVTQSNVFSEFFLCPEALFKERNPLSSFFNFPVRCDMDFRFILRSCVEENDDCYAWFRRMDDFVLRSKNQPRLDELGTLNLDELRSFYEQLEAVNLEAALNNDVEDCVGNYTSPNYGRGETELGRVSLGSASITITRRFAQYGFITIEHIRSDLALRTRRLAFIQNCLNNKGLRLWEHKENKRAYYSHLSVT